MGSAIRLRNLFKSKSVVLLILLIGIVIIFSIWASILNTKFLTIDNILSTADSMIVTSFLAIGAGFLSVSGRLDLSASRSGMFAGVFLAAGIRFWKMPEVFGLVPGTLLLIIAGLLCCAVFGIINATLINIFNFQPFVATLAMASVIDGVTRIVSVDPATGIAMSVNASNDVTNFIGSTKIAGIPMMFFVVVIAFVLYGLILSKTQFGMKMYLVGGNPQAAQLCGINPKRVSYILYVNCAMLAGISGITLMSRLGQGGIDSMIQHQFTGLTAAILGGISFGGGSGNISGVFIGILLLNAFTKGTTIVMFDPYWTNIFSGVLLLTALIMDYFSNRKTRMES